MGLIVTRCFEVAQQTASTGVIAFRTIFERFRVMLVNGSHQCSIDIFLQPLDEIIPIGGIQSLHLIGTANGVLVLDHRPIVEIRGRYVHNHCSMIQDPK